MSISTRALAVLQTREAEAKAAAARSMAADWSAGHVHAAMAVDCPDRPARPAAPALLPPNQMPKRRKAGSLAGRIALLHAVAHIELNAIDLAADMVARFAHIMPPAFTDDWISIADDEARHFMLLQARLKALDSHYGALPAHDGLWQAAEATKDNLIARLAVVPMVLEARGLDVTPDMIKRFDAIDDADSADILRVIYSEEVGHVETGTRWFHHVTQDSPDQRESVFQDLVRQYFHGKLKRPFNADARREAGMPPSYYEPLADE